MKYKTAAVCMSVLMLSACGNKNEQLETFYKQVEKANEKEKPIVETSDKLGQLESDKVRMFEDVNKGSIKTIHATAKKLDQNADERKTVISEEKDAIAASEAEFKKALPLAKSIDDKTRKDEAQDIIDKMETKYETHDQLMSAYEDILAKEKDIFKYLQQAKPSGKTVNQKIEKLNNTTAEFQQLTSKYSQNSNELEKEKKDVVDILNAQ
ncbi:YkyA family protein [Macrococcus lamae]|uniref:EMYY motif lipoprotein n=1 Tax=Macrococcus lamae TaxID=198484 RepID=A0A4R6BVG9_9STAP|nr:YkyA family protein [Macrococcus lamae]TDM12351.1 hypothetical protein ERX29_03230 [Macrococcus lamae]